MLRLLPDAAAARFVASRAPRVSPRRYRLRVLHAADGVVVLESTQSTVMPGRYGLLDRDGSFVQVGDVLRASPEQVVRRLHGELPPQMLTRPVSWTGRLHASPADVGRMPELIELADVQAWQFQALGGERERWAVHLGGLGADGLSALRGVTAADMAGYGSLVLNVEYGGTHTFGVDEREHLRAAIAYLRAIGATRVSIIGWSYGASAALSYIASGADDIVTSLVGVSPLVSWRDAIRAAVESAGLRPSVTDRAMRLLDEAAASGLEVSALGWPGDAPLPIPMLAIHSRGDRTLPFSSTAAFAERNPSVVLSERTPSPHTLEWNAGGNALLADVASFLRR